LRPFLKAKRSSNGCEPQIHKFNAETARVDEAAVKPLPNSRKIYVEGSRRDVRVPMREVSQADTPASFGAEKIPPVTTPPAPTPIQQR
jgi:hypothetical protein